MVGRPVARHRKLGGGVNSNDFSIRPVGEYKLKVETKLMRFITAGFDCHRAESPRGQRIVKQRYYATRILPDGTNPSRSLTFSYRFVKEAQCRS